jgi:hypothetical protein
MIPTLLKKTTSKLLRKRGDMITQIAGRFPPQFELYPTPASRKPKGRHEEATYHRFERCRKISSVIKDIPLTTTCQLYPKF